MLATWNILAVALVLLVGAAAVVLLRHRSPRSGSPARPFALVVTRFGAVAYAIIGLLGTIVTVVQTLASQFVSVALPVRPFWPGAYPWVKITDGPNATITGGGFTTADVTLTGLHMDARLLLAAGHAIQGLTMVVIAVVIAFLCHRLLGGEPFKPVLAGAVTAAAVAVGVGGIAWQVFFQIGGLVSSRQALGVVGWSSQEISFKGFNPDDPAFDSMSTGLPQPAMGFALDFWPMYLALALAAVAVAFRYSARLQRDTEGLV